MAGQSVYTAHRIVDYVIKLKISMFFFRSHVFLYHSRLVEVVLITVYARNLIRNEVETSVYNEESVLHCLKCLLI